jgi:hypothetical protein
MDQDVLSAPNAVKAARASVAGQQAHGDSVFPCVVRCETKSATLATAVEWVRENRDELLNDAVQHGAVLFRDFPLKSAEDFDAFIAAFELQNFPYKK